MKHIFTLILSLCAITSIAQIPQIARVSKTGATTVYTDLKKAIAEAQDDDFIYLPGTIIYADSVIFKKRINIVGTGHYPDSTKVSGRTVINGSVYCFGGGSGGSLQAVAFGDGYGTIYFGSSCENFTISKCKFAGTSSLQGDVNSNHTGLLIIRESIVASYLYSSSAYSIFASNSIAKGISVCSNSKFNNCIFSNYSIYNNSCENNEFRNCIFFINFSGSYYGDSRNNQYFNCHIESNSGHSFYGAPIQLNTTDDNTSGSTFQGGALPTDFSYTFDYRVKSSSAAAGSGTDGTDRGIYGTANPYNPSSYNPHIYFKDIAPATNAQGQLQINVKVKAQ